MLPACLSGMYVPVKARLSSSGLKVLLRLQAELDLGANVRNERHRVWAHFVSILRGEFGDTGVEAYLHLLM